MTQRDYDTEFPFNPNAEIGRLWGIEKLQAIHDPELRRQVIRLHESGAYGGSGPVRMASRVSESDFKQRAAGEG